MIRAFSTLLILFAYAGTPSAYAEPSDNLKALVRQAEEKGLAYHPYWKALMHYRNRVQANNTNLISEIISSDYFLSPRGATDSVDEMAATLVAFFNEPGENPGNHAQCRFIARYKWLRKSLDWEGLNPPSVTCKHFNEWSMNGHIDSLSLVFATGYLSNPASFYGHILLKFNTNRSVISTDFLDESINFGAIVPSNENGFVYVLKGLFGGYDASFSNTRFYRLNHMYAEAELRDMWEYELALNKDEVDQIVAHSWELLRTRFTYYFLKENCAYQMAELLELVIEQPLLPEGIPWAIPATIFNRIASFERNGVPLVRKVNLIPSRLNSYYSKYLMLAPGQKILVKDLALDTIGIESVRYSLLSEPEKINIIDTLIDYYEFRIVGDDKNLALKNSKRKLLVERVGLPSQSPLTAEVQLHLPNSSPPHEGPIPGMIRVGLLQNSQLGTGSEVRFRPAYFDFLELDAGRIPNSYLTMFDLRTTYVNKRLKLRSLDLISIENMNVAHTPLPGDGGLAWKIKLGFENHDLSCGDCMTFNFTGGLGKATHITSNIMAYGMMDYFSQTKYQDSGTIGMTPRVGLIASPFASWKSNFTIGQRRHFNGSQQRSRVIRWDNRIGSHRDWDIRISYEEQMARELQVAVSTYW